jgi:DNA invertase Pin-like site-specific DNA recombinase
MDALSTHQPFVNVRFRYERAGSFKGIDAPPFFVAKPSPGFYVPDLPPAHGYGYIWRMGHLLGYARVSTGGQDAALQQDALQAAGCYRIFTDTASGSLESRPELTKVLDQLRPGDTLVVWRLDRLGRSIRHLIDQLADLQERGIGFRSLQEAIDTTSPGGRLIFHVFAALAEFERDLIRERTNAGLQAARARGRKGGRPALLTREKLETAQRLYAQKEMTVEKIGEVLGVSRTTVYRALRRPPAPVAAPRRSAATRKTAR